MTRKKTVAAATFAPAEGDDPEFEESFRKVLDTLSASGNPEGISPEAVRERLAQVMVKYGGKAYNAAGLFTPPPDDDWGEAVTVEPTTLRTPPRMTEPYWYEEPSQARLIDWYVLSRRELGTDFHGALLITGPAGAGKTQGVAMAIRRINEQHQLNIRLLRMDCATITDPQKWLGRREIDDKGSHYIESDFIRAVREGDAILLDEITRAHPTIANMLHSLLDGSQSLTLSELNLTIPVNPHTVFLATANIGAQFGGTHRMDHALRERFAYTLERDFPPQKEEIRILTTHTGVDADAANVLVAIARKTRDMYGTGDLRMPISTRMLVAAARLVASGATEREALAATAEPAYDGDSNGTIGEKSERAQLRALIDGRAGKPVRR